MLTYAHSRLASVVAEVVPSASAEALSARSRPCDGQPRSVRVNGASGVVETTPRSFNCGGYGGLIDGNGVIWSANGGNNGLLRWDPNAPDPDAAHAQEAPERVLVATVAEDREPYAREVVYLFKTLHRFGGHLRRARRIAYFVGSADSPSTRALADLGVGEPTGAAVLPGIAQHGLVGGMPGQHRFAT
jgi:hypothetical protein